MATGNDSAKLSSLFNKKKKKGGAKSMNANVMAKETTTAAAPPTAAAVASPRAAKTSVKPVRSPAGSPSKTKTSAAAPVKTLSDLTIGDKKDDETAKREFQWAKQPKKYKNPQEQEGVAKTWEEQEERNRVNRRINLQSERAFPTLGADATQVQLSGMKVQQTKTVVTKNVWSTLGHDDDDDEEDD
ncbi:hypothetical protein Poli38472_011360 [Pythium oligandrum]|uniref:Uncharacterized protein n=1 Tax=Pythium oligandrum TaxID=41045 RepID=A0A8K1CJM9_PYTOL|nr:hypothetical protein Poli38472_011360 [Pythium oligandrum]|eukprot:TMW64480.1 hypothetical protein Poli38472_011360 [Pythium oligandrum]